MIILDVEQGSEAWFQARAGVPTASAFKRILTGTGKPTSASVRDTYMYELIAEWMGAQVESFQSEWMARGTELEPQARAYYEFMVDADVVEVGTVFKDARREYSCSPDGLVDDDGGLEIKCPKASTHIKYLLGGKLPTEYVPQVQGSMLVTGRKWWDFLSFHPDLDPFLIRVERDEDYISALETELTKFIQKRDEKLIQLNPISEAA